ncbi:hypothetical protein HZB03_05805 [Candidatus Woesearchaeota archaeon]|nr:hypothetical protein [Candidatus Woesearchaeota archaeon]
MESLDELHLKLNDQHNFRHRPFARDESNCIDADKGAAPQRPSIRWHSISSPVFATLQPNDER